MYSYWQIRVLECIHDFTQLSRHCLITVTVTIYMKYFLLCFQSLKVSLTQLSLVNKCQI
jgi:hypothetical protein